MFVFVFFFDVAMVWKGKPASVTTGTGDRTYVRKYGHAYDLCRLPRTRRLELH